MNDLKTPEEFGKSDKDPKDTSLESSTNKMLDLYATNNKILKAQIVIIEHSDEY